jgi:hypothetical protein
MQPDVLPSPSRPGAQPTHQSIAIANVRWFRAMAWRALRDGGPQAELRAANARAAARIVLRQARRDAMVRRMAMRALAGDA